MAVITKTSDATYLTKPNIVHPGTSTQATAAEVQGRLDTALILNVASVTGGTVKR